MDSGEIKEAGIDVAPGDHCLKNEPVTPAHRSEAVVEGIPVEIDSEKLELANAFRRGNLDGLLATCGYQRITLHMIEESRDEVGKNGITVHLPDRDDVAVRGYYRTIFNREACFTRSPCVSHLHESFPTHDSY